MSVSQSGNELSEHARQLVASYFSDAAFRAVASPLLEQLPAWCPVLDLGPMWLVSGHDEVTSIMGKDCLQTYPEVGGFRLPLSTSPALAKWLALSLPMRDGADHRRLRSLIQPTFAKRSVDALEALVARCIDRRLGDAIERGEMDVVTDLAIPLPMDLSFELLGIPEDDRHAVATWVARAKRGILLGEESDTDADADIDGLAAFIAASVADASPDDSSLLAVLARASHDGLLTAEELRAYVFLLLVNGLDTLTSAIVDAVYQLLQPGRADGARPMSRDEATAFFEEVLRYFSPVRFSARVLTDHVDLAESHLPEGDVIALFFAAANRDPRHFDRPGSFDPARPRGRHLAFGHGVHQCVGRHLANLAGAVVLERFSSLGDRVTLSVASEDLDWSGSLLYNTLEALPLAIAS